MSSSPPIPTPTFDQIPQGLIERPQWVGWHYEHRHGRLTKVPVNPHTGRPIDVKQPDNWLSFEEVVSLSRARGLGIGFAFAANDPFAGVDLDKCRDPETGELAPWAAEIVQNLNSYTEISPSGTGLKVFVRGTLPAGGNRKGQIEMYDRDRFFTVTGQHLAGTPTTIEERGGELAALHGRVFAEPTPASESVPAARITPHLGDEEIVERALAAKNGARFARLLRGDAGDYGSPSEADLAFCSFLTPWTEDPQQIDRIMRGSGLCRGKWEGREDYRRRTIEKALSGSKLYVDTSTTGATFEFTAAKPGTTGTGVANWPDPPDAAAYYGLAGRIVHTLDPATEADPAGVLLSLLAAIGNIVGPRPHWQVSGRPHSLRINPVLVGATSKGRKGTAWATIKPLLKAVVPDWLDRCVTSGLNSAEGLIWAVRDPIEKTEPIREEGRPKGEITGYRQVVVDQGVEDKRLLVIEEEFASTLKVMGREGNTLSPLIRQAWDDGDLRTIVKNNPARATGAHITIMGHITGDELKRYLEDTETANGFANRFLWGYVRRSKLLPHGGHVDPGDYKALVEDLTAALAKAKGITLMWRDDDANKLWEHIYGPLSAEKNGLLGAVTSRAEAQVMRLAAIYALLDGSSAIRPPHLEAAVALWDYLEASARFIFGDALGDPVADTIQRALRTGGKMTKTQISKLFGNNISGARIDRALELLLSTGMVRCEKQEDTGGRPTTVYEAA